MPPSLREAAPSAERWVTSVPWAWLPATATRSAEVAKAEDWELEICWLADRLLDKLYSWERLEAKWLCRARALGGLLKWC